MQSTRRTRIGGSRPTDALRFALLLAAIPLPGLAQTHEWTGANSTVWSDAANWTGDGPPPVSSFGTVYFNDHAAPISQVDLAYSGSRILFGPLSQTLNNGTTVGGDGGNGSVTLTALLTNDADATHTLDAAMAFDASGGFVNVDNLGSSGAPNGFEFTANAGPATVAAGTTLGIDNTAGRALFSIHFRGSLDGGGSLQVGTRPFVSGTEVNLYGNNTLSGDLRMRNAVNVLQTASEHASLSAITGIFIESPVDFTVNRARLSFGATDGSPILLTPPDFIADAATINLFGGHLSFVWPGGNYTSAVIEETGPVNFRFGHSLISLDGTSTTDSFTFSPSSLNADAGATALARVRITDAIPLDPPPFLGPGFFVVDSAPATIGGSGNFSDPLDTEVSIIPWLAAADDSDRAVSFTTYDAILGVRPLDDTQYADLIESPSTGALDNVSVFAETLLDPSARPAGYEINALRMSGTDTGNSSVLDLSGNTLSVVSGAILLAPEQARTIANGNIAFGSNPGIVYTDAAGSEISAAITGSQSLTFSGTQALILSGANSYDGTTYLNQDIILRNSAGLGSATGGTEVNQDVRVIFEPGTSAIGDTFTVRGSAAQFVARDTSVDLNGDILIEPTVAGEAISTYFSTEHANDSGASMTIEGNITPSTQPTDLVFASQGDQSTYGGAPIRVNGVISDAVIKGSPDTRLFKRGFGDLILANDNTVQGDTFISAGRLLATGQTPTGSATGDGNVFVAGDAFAGTLQLPAIGGDGRVAGNVSLFGGAVDPHGLASASPFGNLSIGGDVSFATASFSPAEEDLCRFLVDLAGSIPGPTANDQLFLFGSAPVITLDSEVKLVITLQQDVAVGDFFDIVLAPGGTLTINGLFLADDGINELTDLETFTISSVFGPKSLRIDYTTDRVRLEVVPEPASALLVAAGLGACAAAPRRRWRR